MGGWSENIGLAIGAASAFVGALSGVAGMGWWLARQFNNVYRKMDEHEIKDIERFSDLKMKIAEVKIQAQTLEGFKHKRSNRDDSQ